MKISMDLLNTTGKRIRLLRNDLGLTQEELTRQLNKDGVEVGRSYISILETSSKVPSGEVIQALARVLKTTSDYLLLLTDDPLRPGEIDEEARQVSDQEWDLVTAMRSLPDPDRLTLMEMTKELIGVARRQRQRTGRSMTDLAPALPASQVPPLPRSREELASYVLALSAGVWPQSAPERLRANSYNTSSFSHPAYTQPAISAVLTNHHPSTNRQQSTLVPAGSVATTLPPSPRYCSTFAASAPISAECGASAVLSCR